MPLTEVQLSNHDPSLDLAVDNKKRQSTYSAANYTYIGFCLTGSLFGLSLLIGVKGRNVAFALFSVQLFFVLVSLYLATFVVSINAYRYSKKNLSSTRLIDKIMMNFCLLVLISIPIGYFYDQSRISADTKSRCADLQKQFEEKKITGYYTQGCENLPSLQNN